MILTTEGLSAVFGAVVESRKIFARLFSYVSYRLAATIQILLFLSILVYVFDCTLDPLHPDLPFESGSLQSCLDTVLQFPSFVMRFVSCNARA